MKIFVASGIFHPESGGPSTYLYHLLPWLQARGHTIRVLAFGDAPNNDYPYAVRRIPRRNLPVRMADYARAAWPEIGWSDLIFMNSLGLPLIGAGRRPRILKVVGDLAWERSVNKGWISATEDIDYFQTAKYDWRVEFLKQRRAREVRRMDQIIVPSQYLRQMVIGWGAAPERVQVIYNALDPNVATSQLSRSAARAELGLDSGPYLLTTARLVRWKGIDYLIRVLGSLPEVRLLIAGDGPEESSLRALADSEGVADRAIFLGRVKRERLAHYLRAVDYAVLYSGYEGLSHFLLESMLAGTPAIASDKGGNPEVIRHGENGLLVPYGDPGALIETIHAAFLGDTREKLAAGTGIGLERFRWATLVEQTAAALEGLCAS